jgi:acyl-CoA reductase-like NAD-dependent aldehyde dehydrogenase
MSETKKTAKTAKASKAAKTSLLEDVAAEVTAPAAAPAAPRSSVRKTYKLYIGGAFPRSESGRSYAVTASTGEFIANAAQASRKDARDAVRAARAAQPGWAKATAYNRGQILYRVAEMLEGRRAQFAEYTDAAEVDAAIDRWVHYAGWADKYPQIVGSTNPVARPYFTFSLPEPTGVVGVLAPQDSALLGLVSVIAPVITTGNTVVVVAAQDAPLPAISLAEVLETSDLPAGVVNILTGFSAELAPWLASHRDVNALDLTGAAPGVRADLQASAADNVKRVYVPRDADWTAAPGLSRLNAFVETKTVWHPIGV